ncbi:MAG TPA: cytochrome c oxidase assembly protein [Gaiellaceae bacterium]|jgi:putative membrane protein
MSPTDFSFEPFYLVVAAVLALAYGRARPAGRWRIASFVVGLFLLAAPLNSPMETIAATRLLLIHLLQNALIADIAPLLILLGLTPAMKAWVARHGGDRVRARWAIVVWLVAWYGTHLAGFYDWALRTGWGLNIEHGLLIAGGFLFWWPIVSGRLPAPLALAYLGAAFVASSFLGLAFIFSSHPFYSFYEHAPRLWGFSPTRDQNLGGIAMNGEQTLVFLVAIGYYVSRLLSEEAG